MASEPEEPRDTDPAPVELSRRRTPVRRRPYRESIGHIAEVTKAKAKLYLTTLAVLTGIVAGIGGLINSKLATNTAEDAQFKTEQLKKPIAQQDHESNKTYKIGANKWTIQAQLNKKLVEEIRSLRAELAEYKRRDESKRRTRPQPPTPPAIQELLDAVSEPFPSTPAAAAAEDASTSEPKTP